MIAAIPAATVPACSHVLLVDDEPNVLSALSRSLRGRGFEVTTTGGGDEALALLRREPVDAIVCDMRMPGLSGAQVLKESLALAPDAVRVLLTGHSEIQSAVQAVNEGEIFRYLAKPWDDAFLHQVLRDGLARKALERERDALVALTEQQNEQLRRINAGLEEQVAQRTLELEATVASLRKVNDRLKDELSRGRPVVAPARKMLISSQDVRAGMRLAQDLVTAGGALLLAHGRELDDAVIAHIRRLEQFSGEFLWIAVSGDDEREVRIAGR